MKKSKLKEKIKEKIKPARIGTDDQPLSKIQWLHREYLVPNGWNPNKQAPAETDLLEISILEDGWTQPIVALEVEGEEDLIIIDGFHRHHVSGRKKILEMTEGYIPVVILRAENEAHKQMSTIRHNRARGTHAVLPMAKIVQNMLGEGLSKEEICTRLQMEIDEVERLALRVGIASTDDITKSKFGNAWEPK